MVEPFAVSHGRNASIAHDLSISFALMLPQGDGDVTRFLSEAAFALGIRDADLSRMLGVSPATLSSWKRRDTIPKAPLDWFATEFVPAVLLSRDPSYQDFRHAGMELALRLYRETDFNPFALDDQNIERRILKCARYLGPIARLSLFVMHRTIPDADFADATLDRVRALLRAAAPMVAT